jgi:hypothetical protein
MPPCRTTSKSQKYYFEDPASRIPDPKKSSRIVERVPM